MLNWIIWNRTIFIKIDLALNNLQRLIWHKTQATNQQTNQPTNQTRSQNKWDSERIHYIDFLKTSFSEVYKHFWLIHSFSRVWFGIFSVSYVCIEAIHQYGVSDLFHVFHNVMFS